MLVGWGCGGIGTLVLQNSNVSCTANYQYFFERHKKSFCGVALFFFFFFLISHGLYQLNNNDNDGVFHKHAKTNDIKNTVSAYTNFYYYHRVATHTHTHTHARASTHARTRTHTHIHTRARVRTHARTSNSNGELSLELLTPVRNLLFAFS